MLYLDILIGFSLIMLVFASAVSAAQSLLKRAPSLKGRAIVEPLLDEIGRKWQSSALKALSPETWERLKGSFTESLKRSTGGMGAKLHFGSLRESQNLDRM